MKRIKEIVIVEGKTDTQLLKELYDVDTIETHGLALNDKTLELIKEASLTRGVIVLTDPGTRISQKKGFFFWKFLISFLITTNNLIYFFN